MDYIYYYLSPLDSITLAGDGETLIGLCEFTAKLFKLENVRFEKSHAFITGKRADYAILPQQRRDTHSVRRYDKRPAVHSQHRGKLFLPFVDDDTNTAQIVMEILFFAEDKKIKDPYIIEQIDR